MAKKTVTKTATSAYYEVVMKGSPKAVRGLLAGLVLGRDLEQVGWYHHEADIAPGDGSDSLRRAAEKLHLLPVSEVRAVVPAPLAKLLRSTASAIAATEICEVAAVKRIKQAQVEIRYHTFARRYDDEVQLLLRDLPRGVKLSKLEREVETDTEAKGVEAYTAVHHFESSGSAILAGRFDLVLDLRDRLDVHPLIECDEIELVLA